MSLNHMIDTYLKAKYEPAMCELCENNEVYEDGICHDCFMERAQDRAESMRDAYD